MAVPAAPLGVPLLKSPDAKLVLHVYNDLVCPCSLADDLNLQRNHTWRVGNALSFSVTRPLQICPFSKKIMTTLTKEVRG